MLVHLVPQGLQNCFSGVKFRAKFEVTPYLLYLILFIYFLGEISISFAILNPR